MNRRWMALLLLFPVLLSACRLRTGHPDGREEGQSPTSATTLRAEEALLQDLEADLTQLSQEVERLSVPDETALQEEQTLEEITQSLAPLIPATPTPGRP